MNEISKPTVTSALSEVINFERSLNERITGVKKETTAQIEAAEQAYFRREQVIREKFHAAQEKRTTELVAAFQKKMADRVKVYEAQEQINRVVLYEKQEQLRVAWLAFLLNEPEEKHDP